VKQAFYSPTHSLQTRQPQTGQHQTGQPQTAQPHFKKPFVVANFAPPVAWTGGATAKLPLGRKMAVEYSFHIITMCAVTLPSTDGIEIAK